MINTLRSQIIIAATVVIMVSATVIIIYIHKDVKKSIEEIEMKSVENILNFINLSLRDNFNYKLRSKYKMCNIYKNRLMINMDNLFHCHKDKIIKNLKVDYMLKYNENKDMAANPKRMIIDKSRKIIHSTEDDLVDKHIKKCDKNTELYLSESEQFSFFCIKEDGNNENYNFGYFKPFSYNDEKLKVVSFYNKKDFDVKSENKDNEIIKDLEEILKDLKIANTGFSFIFQTTDEEDKIITKNKEKKSFCKNTNNRETCLENLISELKTDKIDKIDKKNFPFEGNILNITIRYFKGFDWHYAVVFPASEIEEKANTLVKKLLIIITLIISFSIIIISLIISRITNSLAILSRKMERVPEHDFTGDDHSELLDGLPVGAHNEAGQLAQTFFFMIDRLSGSIKQLIATTAANERMETELNFARKIQLDLLPKDFSEAKRKVGDLHAYLNPAREIGGDLYDFFFIDDEHLCFTVGDVADKGVSAALFMVCAKKMIKSYAVKGGTDSLSPAEITGEINEMLCNDNATATFITLFIGILNVKNGELRYANGGHVPPIFVDCGSEPQYRKDVSGPAVGVRPGFRYKDITTALQPGGVVFLCTDGVTEAMNEVDELFGNKRLLDDFSSMKDKSCKEVVDGILYEVRMHAGTAPQSDDIAMLMLRWGVKGKDGEDYV